MLICRQNIQHRKFVVRGFLIQDWVKELDLRDPWLINEDGIEEVDCDPRMLRTSQHELEGEVDEGADSNGHV